MTKLLMLGDSPLVQTGFGRVNHRVMTALSRELPNWELAAVTSLQSETAETALPFKQHVPAKSDAMGLFKAIEVFESDDRPDIIYITGDPGSVSAYASVIPAAIPVSAYVPIEGEPIMSAAWRSVLSAIDFSTCSQYGTQVAQRDIGVEVPYVYHGVDTDVFTPLDDEERASYRSRLGWDDKFVIVCVATNVRRKQLTRLIEALALLKHEYKQKDIVLYLHTVPFQNYWLEGWNLPEVAQGMQVSDLVQFNPLMSGFGKAIPERGDLDVPGLRELIGSSDLFVLPSQVEGFGLPIAEAMACGVPVAVTKYGAGWEVAKLGQGLGLPIGDWEIHKSGTRYANVDVREMAKAILGLKRDPRRLQRMRAAGLAAVPQFDWGRFEEHIVGQIEASSRRNAAGNEQPTEDNPRREEAGS